ncbi:MAG: SGNH/GDSL hydrolase family protein [Thermodesulfobacteriota bacterium]
MRKIKAGQILLLVLSTILILVIAEIGLRLIERLGYFSYTFKMLNSAYTPFDVKTGEGLYYSHPYISYEMKPGYSIPGEVTINSLGYRGEEFDAVKSPGVYRIVALGGSTTYGIGLADDETYPYYLQKELRERLGTDKIEVINAGLVSATTAESLSRFLHKILPLDPDMVIFYEGYNDLPPRMFDGFSDDYYHFRKNPQNHFSLLSNSLLYRLAASGFRATLHYPNTTLLSEIWKFENLPAEDDKKIDNFNSTSSAVYERNLDYIIALARAKDITVVLSTFVFDEDAPNWNDYMPDVLWGKGIGQNNDVIKKLARKYDLPLIDLYSYGLGNKHIFLDSVHLTAGGNEEMAAVFAETIAPVIEKETENNTLRR